MRAPGRGSWLGVVLLALARVVAAAHDAPAAGDPVVSVTLELKASERAPLERYVDLLAGAPYDPERVRHAVELLFATGGFEDVVVEAQREPGGWALRLRPQAAPRFTGVRVSGERVLSAGVARKLARLHSGEPLWPARLERAARDVALALAADGWLEARVQARAERTPAGAVAVFDVQAGPRVRVESALLKDVSGAPVDESLRTLARPRPGAVYRREQAQRAAVSLRRTLVARGRWRARVESREAYDPQSGRVVLTFELEPGPVTSVEFVGAPIPASLRRSLTALLREGGLSVDAVESAAERIETLLRDAGHREPVVAQREEARPGRVALVYDVQPGPVSQVYRVRVTGADDVEPPLPPLLQTRLDLPLRDATLDEDVRGLRRALQERGYVEATVEADVREGGGLLPVTLRVRPGPRTLVTAVTVAAPEREGIPTPALRVAAGQPYRVADVAADVAALQSAWRDAGFLQAEVTPESELSDDKSEARVTLRVTSGARTLVDRLIVTGLEHTREEVVRRELRLEEGQPLGFGRVLESQRRLGALGLFRRASLRELDPAAPERRSVVVSVEEAPRTTVAYGVGYAERERVRGSLEVTRRNLFGLDRSLTLFGRGSLRGSRALVSFREPYLLGRRQELFLTGFRESEDRVSFDFTRLGGLLQTALSLGTHTGLILRLQYQRTELFNVDVPLSDVDRQFQNSTTAGPSASLLFDTRDDPLDPQRGVFVGADTQLSQRFLGGERFIKGFAQAASFQRLRPGLLLALHARVGLARTFGSDSPPRLPLAERFFAGGDYSLRGFATDAAGPSVLSEDGTRRVPTGGNALLLAGAELRLDATRFVALALFGDAGNVFPLVSDVAPSDLRYTLGLGLRYKSALGPLRVDWGYKLDRRPGEAASHLHITVGHAF